MKSLTNRKLTLFCCGMILSGCAGLVDQTAENEPHASVTIGSPLRGSASHGTIKSIDQAPVRVGQSYRLRPGSHAVVVEFIENEVESAGPVRATVFSAGNGPSLEDPAANVHLSQSGEMSVSGANPFSTMQPVNLSVENRHLRARTTTIQVKAGRSYVFDGTTLVEKPPQ